MRCGNCGTDQQVGATFCSKCGARIAAPVCPNCHTPASAGQRFCEKCGTSLTDTGAGLAPPPGVGSSTSGGSSGTGARGGRSAGPPPPPPVGPTTAAPRRGGGACFLTGCLVIVVLLVVLVGGGYYAYTSGMLTQRSLLTLIGRGPGSVEVNNFRDNAIQVSIRQMDVSEGSSPVTTALNLNAFDVRSYRVENPGRYLVDFQAAKGGASIGSCTLNVRSGDAYQFVTLPGKIVVNRKNNPAKVGTDFVVQTSSLCR